MKLTSAVIFCTVLVSAALAQNKYTNKYDNIDVDRILGNDRILTNYIKCLMDEGPCTPEGRELKKTLPDALSSGCTKCNQNQKETSQKVIRHLQQKRTKDWDRLTKKFDPQGLYKKRYDEHGLQSEGPVLQFVPVVFMDTREFYDWNWTC